MRARQTPPQQWPHALSCLEAQPGLWGENGTLMFTGPLTTRPPVVPWLPCTLSLDSEEAGLRPGLVLPDCHLSKPRFPYLQQLTNP